MSYAELIFLECDKNINIRLVSGFGSIYLIVGILYLVHKKKTVETVSMDDNGKVHGPCAGYLLVKILLKCIYILEMFSFDFIFCLYKRPTHRYLIKMQTPVLHIALTIKYQDTC